MLDKYGCWVTAPSQPSGAQRETLLIEAGGGTIWENCRRFFGFSGCHGSRRRAPLVWVRSALCPLQFRTARHRQKQKAVEVYALTPLPPATNPARFQTLIFFHALD